MDTATVVLITLVVYKVVLLSIGVWASARNRSETDFLLGGRKLNASVAGLSYAASTSSAWVLLGLSGFVYSIGLSAIWMVLGMWISYAVVWLVCGPKLQHESQRFQQVTLTDFLLQDACGRWRQVAASLATLFILVCFVFYIAAQFDAAGRSLTEHFSMSLTQAVLLGAGIVLTYSILGGFWAVSITDTLQAVVMMVVSVTVPLTALLAAGGPIQVWQELSIAMPAAYLRLDNGYSALMLLGFVAGLMGMSLGPLGQPHLLNRLMAVRNAAERRRGFAITLGWGIIVLSGMVILGLSGRALLPAMTDSEVLFYRIASDQLPAIFAGIVIAATLSAVMSTVDSILLAASGAVAHDLPLGRRFPNYQVLVSRIVMLSIALLAVTLTLYLPDTIFNRVLFAWSALGAAFGPIVIWRVAGRRVNAVAAVFSMTLGFGFTVLFYVLGTLNATNTWYSVTAHFPGDIGERVLPWLPCLLVLFGFARRRSA